MYIYAALTAIVILGTMFEGQDYQSNHTVL